MSADRENHDMTQTDITFLLAEAADEVEVGIAPVQAVIRGGRRRRARRWAVTAATALVVAGSMGSTLAVTGLPGDGRGDRGAGVADGPVAPDARHVYAPQVTRMGWGTYRGREWAVSLQVWDAPRDEVEAERQLEAMTAWGVEPVKPTAWGAVDVGGPADLIGRTSYFAMHSYGGSIGIPELVNTVGKPQRLSGADLEARATRLGDQPESAGRLVIGLVAKTAKEVTCTWKDGRTTVAVPEPGNSALRPEDGVIRPVHGYPGANWFVCVAPDGTTYKSAKVTG
ncbi:hypothetical protein ABZ079_04570 [Streptomyces sp. NPDC006314]|uniref:hypothetical protein n=1 Tax=Streptomyces sp. NPDC006314 TaxID=3154475 RepID=UPI0033BB5527